MIRVCTRWALCAAALFGALPASAQPPLQFNNTAQALRQYEQSTLEGLRQRCSSAKDGGYASAPELQQLRNGFAEIGPPAPQSGRYEVLLFDQDKRSFVLIEGQALRADERLHLRLALPRDYARCRIVRESSGAERLEVVHTERNYVSDAQMAQRLLQQAQEIAPTAPAAACAIAPRETPPTSSGSYRVAQSVWWELPLCHDALGAARQRLSRLAHRVLDR
ncbi:MAG: hypothetical protein ACT4NV_10230 [Rhodoferax sp.]